MEKGPFDVRKSDVPPLRPVVAPIPEAPVRMSATNLPRSLDHLLANAIGNRASEVLIEREPGRIRVRQRIRGVLITDLRAPLSPTDMAEIFDYVFKSGEQKTDEGLRWAGAQLDISFNQVSYTCRFMVSENKNFGLITVHLTAASEKPFNPAAWGMGPNQALLLEGFLSHSHGMVLFCGIESDDVFSTLQSAAKQLVTPERHAIAVSAQPQAWFPGIEPMVSNANPERFLKLLRVAFQHEPDLVVAHPLETKSQFELCLSEAIRGRLVFARVYASDISDALLQIIGMGIEPYLIGSGMMGIVAQRTLRLNCPKCQDKETVSRDRLKEIGVPIGMQPAAFFNGKGCDDCFKTGFDRETNIFEVIEMSDDLRNRLGRDVKPEVMRSIMKTGGLMTLRQVALHKAINGQTSLAEVLRVTT